MGKRFTSRWVLIFTSFWLGACQVNSQLQGYLGSKGPQDFAKTEIIVGSPAPADGTSQLLVVVHLKNSNNSSVPNYRPQYSISAPAGVTAAPCTESDNNGVSACIVKSSVAGVKTLTLTNALAGLSKNIEFTAASGIERINVVSGSVVTGTTPNGSKMQVTLGNPLQGVNAETPAGYKVKLSLQGVAP